MAIDFTKMQQKLNALQGRGGGDSKQNIFWKPQDGDQTVRIVPTADGDPFKQYYFHYNVGKNPGFICPKKQHGKECPVCNFAWSTWQEAKASNDADTMKFCKTLFPKERFFSPVLIRGSYPVTKIHPRRRPSALAESDKIVSMLDSIPEFDSNFNQKTQEEIEQMLSEFLSAEAGESAGSESTKYSSGNTKEASDVDAAFKELLS